MKYNCVPCAYTTDRKTDINRHNKTLKHLEKVEELTNESMMNPSRIQCESIVRIHKCAYCENTFSTQSNRSKHMKICSQKVVQEIVKEKDDAIKEIIKEKDEAIKEKDNEVKDIVIDNLKKELERVNKELNLFADLLKSAMSPTTVNNIAYITNTYTKAPALKQLESYSHILEAKTLSLIDVLHMYHQQGTLCQFIGEFLVTSYVKKDANDQSLWSSDTSRLTYIVNELQESGKIKWVIDKKGIKLKKNVVNPLLQYLRGELDKYIDKYSRGTETHVLTRLKSVAEIYSLIDNDTLANDIIKYMAPHFALIKEDAEPIKQIEGPIKQIEGSKKEDSEVPKKENLCTNKKNKVLVV